MLCYAGDLDYGSKDMEYLKLIELTGGFVAKLLGLKKDRKLEVAGFLSEIADTLSQFSSRIRAGASYEELAGLAQQAGDYAAKFSDATKDILNPQETARFQALLSQAHDAKDALVQRPPAERDERLRLISEVAGSLRVSAATLRGAASQIKS